MPWRPWGLIRGIRFIRNMAIGLRGDVRRRGWSWAWIIGCFEYAVGNQLHDDTTSGGHPVSCGDGCGRMLGIHGERVQDRVTRRRIRIVT